MLYRTPVTLNQLFPAFRNCLTPLHLRAGDHDHPIRSTCSCRTPGTTHKLWRLVCYKSTAASHWSRPLCLHPPLPSCGHNHFCLGDIINTWLPWNSEPISWAKNEREDSSLPVNNLSTQSLFAALWNRYVPLQEVHKEAGSSLSDQLCRKIKTGEWSLVCVCG